MTNVDLYQQCPCGSGKKLKFCCGADIAHELESIQRALDGNQRVVALDLAQRAVATKGQRPALLVMQFELALANEKYDVADSALRELLRMKPKDAGTLALKCAICEGKDDLRGAVDTLQDALELIPDKTEVPLNIVRAYQQVGAMLLERGAYQAALAHFMAASQIVGHTNSDLLGLVQRISASAELPAESKDIPPLATAPEGAAWKTQFEDALSPARRGLWRKARNQFRMMAENLSQEPAVLKNLAIMQSMLGDAKATAAAWRVYSRLPSLPLDEAVDAEIFAQLADPGEPTLIDRITRQYPIKNIDTCMEHLLSDKRCIRAPLDTSEWDPDQGPPPKAAFIVLDRALPASSADLTLADAPRFIGHVFIFGKQTDRPALLEVELDKDETFESSVGVIESVAGEFLDAPLTDELTEKRALTAVTLSQSLVFPKDVPAAQQAKLSNELRLQAMSQRWTRVPLWECGRKPAVEAAQDPKQKIPLLAVLLKTEAAMRQSGIEMDANPVRRELGLPEEGPIEVSAERPLERITLGRLWRVAAEKLSDDDLGRALQRAVTKGQRGAMRNLALAAVERTGEVGAGLAVAACEVLVSISTSTDEGLDWIQRGRQIAEANKLSPARLKVLECEMRVLRGEFEVFAQLLRGLLENEAKQHRDVAMMLYATMTRLGLVTQDGKFVIPSRSRGPGPGGPPGVPPAPAGLWTPGSPTPAAAPAAPASAPAAAPPAGKSKLWLPGMD